MIKGAGRRTGLLLKLSAGLAAIVAIQLAAGPFFVPNAPTRLAKLDMSNELPEDSLFEAPPLADFAEIVERPLFSESRRPRPEEEVQEAAKATASALSFDLIGVLMSPETRIALLRLRTKSEILRVTVGQTVSGWEIKAIEPTQVVLRRGSSSETLTLEDTAKRSYAAETSPYQKWSPSQEDDSGDSGDEDPNGDGQDEGVEP